MTLHLLFHLWMPLGILTIAIVVAQLAWRLTGRASDESPRQNIRSASMEVNQEFERIFHEKGLPAPLLVNCGSAPNDGTGDRIEVGMAKIRDNLIRLFPKE